ncbi:hypothetical protein M3Y98_00738300 [Aphelenchoides besseyi]|nr:hypothetical protein M3Y98_00738300 [Aphelenchoides besseyi]
MWAQRPIVEVKYLLTLLLSLTAFAPEFQNSNLTFSFQHHNQCVGRSKRSVLTVCCLFETTTSDGAYKTEMLVKRLAVGAKAEGDAILLLFLQTQSSNGTNDIKLVKVIKGELKPL